jgi:hypothetical protein
VFPWFTGSTNSRPANSGTSNQAASSPPAPAPGPSSGNSSSGNGTSAAPTCPKISLKLNSIEIYDNIINDPDRSIVVVCYNKEGSAFAPVIFNTTSDVVRSISGARYRPSEPVAQIACGESISCTVGYSEPGSDDVITSIAEGGCWFDYRHFTQLSYQEPMSAWTCTKPPVRYTLECLECSDQDFPWEDALALAGPPLSDGDGLGENPTLNSVMVIISVSIVAGAVILVVTALLIRGRRRSIEENVRVTELIMARGRDHAQSQRRRRSSFKPPAVFVVGKPIDGPPPPGYTGPIVVLHCGDEGEEEEEEYYYNKDREKVVEEVEDEEVGASGSRSSDDGEKNNNKNNTSHLHREKGVVRWPQIAIARPEVAVSEEGGDGGDDVVVSVGGELEGQTSGESLVVSATSSVEMEPSGEESLPTLSPGSEANQRQRGDAEEGNPTRNP